MSDPLKYSYDFDPTETGQTSSSIYTLVDAGGPRVLDVGSGPAIVSTVLQRRSGKQVTCLDLDEQALAAAAGHGLETFVADLESADVFDDVQGREFDTVVLADVLEHLRNPAELLERILGSGLLAPDGQLVISFPNATHGSILAELVAGDFRYTTTGILDYTHLRWFTLRSMTRMLEGLGLGVVRVLRTPRGIGHLGSARTSDAVATVSALTQTLPEVDTYQYVLGVRRMDEAGTVALLRSQLQDVGGELRTTEAELRTTEAELRTTEAELVATEAELRTTEAGLVATRGELRTAQAELRTAVASARAAEERYARVEEQLRGELVAARAVEPPCLPTHEADHEADQAELEHLRTLLAEEQQYAIDELQRAADSRGSSMPGVPGSPVRVSALERRAAKLERDLEATRSSESYRIGHALVRRARRVQRLVQPRVSG